MSGFEVLGAVTGAIQLADAGLAIIKAFSVLYSTLHDAPESFKRFSTQIQHLIDVARLIRQNPSLQTALISSLLMNCVEKARELEAILEKATAKLNAGKIEKYWRTLGGVMKAKRISELCASLEGEKSALSLCIASINSEMLQSIDTRFVVLDDGVNKLQGALPDIRETAQGITEILNEVKFLRQMTGDFRTELFSVLGRLFEVANLDKSIGKTSESLDAAQIVEIQNTLPALRHALERLTIKESSTVDAEVQMGGLERNNAGETQEYTMNALSSLGTTDQDCFIAERLSLDKHACRWFLEHPQVSSWLSKQDLRAEMLYVTARAGCGKTTIMAHTIQYMKSMLLQTSPDKEVAQAASTAQSRPIILYFLFQKRSLEDESTATAAMKAIIRQFLKQRPEFLPVFLGQYESLSTKQSFSWSLAQLWAVFLEVLGNLFKTTIYLLLDGLDECEGSSQRMLLANLEKLMNVVVDQDAESPTSRYILRILITGRPDEQLPDIMTFSRHFEVSSLDTAWDMGVFIDSRVTKFASRRSLDPQTAKDLCSFLNKRAEGMFLWVVQVMEELDRRDVRLSDKAIEAALQNVPITLYSQYEETLKSAPKSRQTDLWHILRWILTSRRVLSLAELEVALCTELGISRWYDLKGDLNFLCGSVIRFENETVSFIHQTFREFLYDYISTSPRQSTGGLCMDLHGTETQITIACLEILGKTTNLEELSEQLGQGCLHSNKEVDAWLRGKPFLAYAAEFWASHLGVADSFAPHFQPIHLRVTQIFKSPVKRDMLMRLDYFLRHSKHPRHCRCGSTLHVAAYFKLPILVDYYLDQGASTTQDAGGNSHPLVWACETGSYECINKLLKAGADPNQQEYDGWTPLHWAATNGHERVCDLLIRYGARIDIEDNRGYSPKDMAIQMGHVEIAMKYFGGVEGGKEWVPSKHSPHISIIGRRRVAA
ncbi:uncharacterized protein PAC_15329 [Phialocephala subalpina]|uniref:Uncharacterized protein n=1 Tax=Phialocephala subalpina TaxID=576137 RepID=A0A1L7XK57_9HELO|nr:uncharacterized protein PAC_15329 [Phialocephala subalpina]